MQNRTGPRTESPRAASLPTFPPAPVVRARAWLFSELSGLDARDLSVSSSNAPPSSQPLRIPGASQDPGVLHPAAGRFAVPGKPHFGSGEGQRWMSAAGCSQGGFMPEGDRELPRKLFYLTDKGFSANLHRTTEAGKRDAHTRTTLLKRTDVLCGSPNGNDSDPGRGGQRRTQTRTPISLAGPSTADQLRALLCSTAWFPNTAGPQRPTVRSKGTLAPVSGPSHCT